MENTMDNIAEIVSPQSFLDTLSQRMRIVFLMVAAVTITIIRILGPGADSVPVADVKVAIVAQDAPLVQLTARCPVIGC